MPEVRAMSSDDLPGILAVAGSLPDWFDEDARTRAIPADIRHQNGFVASEDGEVVGFITLFVCEGRLNIGWLGVKPGNHRQGIGTALIEAAEALAIELGLSELATFTLGENIEYAPYVSTRAFYRARGFEIYQRSTTDNPGCPEEIKISKRIDTGTQS